MSSLSQNTYTDIFDSLFLVVNIIERRPINLITDNKGISFHGGFPATPPVSESLYRKPFGIKIFQNYKSLSRKVKVGDYVSNKQ